MNAVRQLKLEHHEHYLGQWPAMQLGRTLTVIGEGWLKLLAWVVLAHLAGVILLPLWIFDRRFSIMHFFLWHRGYVTDRRLVIARRDGRLLQASLLKPAGYEHFRLLGLDVIYLRPADRDAQDVGTVLLITRGPALAGLLQRGRRRSESGFHSANRTGSAHDVTEGI